MPSSRRSMKVRAQLISIGGGVFVGVVLLIAMLTVEVLMSPASPLVERVLLCLLFVSALVYGLDSWSEVVYLDGTRLLCDSWFKRKQSVDLASAREIELIHEGLNPETGIISIKVRYSGKDEQVLALGPLWQRRHLERFFQFVEKQTGKQMLVEELR